MNIRQEILKAGVIGLKDFGYPSVTEENILTDTIYSAFFEEMLKDNIYELEEKENRTDKENEVYEVLVSLKKEIESRNV